MSKVLFMPVGFFEYDKVMEEEMRNMGYDVTTFSPMASYGGFWQKVRNTLSKGNYIKQRAYKMQKDFFESCEEQYDFVLAIVGRDIDPELFARFKEKQKKAKFILYIWDDLHITKKFNFDAISPYFDEIVSYCPQDSEKYGFRYRPTFYTNYYLYKGQKKQYQISMMGTSHSGRVNIWCNLINKYNTFLSKTYLYLVCGTVKDLLMGKIFLKKQGLKSEDLHIFSVSLKDSAEIMMRSQITLDIPQTGQMGVTMRTYESIAAKTKLITTNPYVKDYDFYNPNNICIIDKDNPEVPKEFWDTPFEEVDEQIMEKYTVKQWVKDIFS